MSEVGSCKYQPVNKYVGNEPIEEDFFAGEKECCSRELALLCASPHREARGNVRERSCRKQ